ncbi:septum formation initiator family protein [Kistimonas scapharcae]
MRIVMIMLAFLLALLQYRLWVGEGSIAQLMAVKEQVALQKLENQRLAERNRLLAVDVVALQTGLEAVEEYARTELGMIRHDEEFFLMAD